MGSSGADAFLMKKYLLTALGLGGAAALYFFCSTPVTRTDLPPAERKRTTAAVQKTDVVHIDISSTNSPATPEMNAAKAVPVAAVENVTQAGTDFNWGEFDRTVLRKDLQLAAGALENEADQAGTTRTGTYVSSRHQGHPAFDTISIGYTAVLPEGSTLQLEISLMNAQAEWSPWMEVSMEDLHQPLAVDAVAAGWQYRLTFSAPSVDASPRVQSVKITTRNSRQETELSRN